MKKYYKAEIIRAVREELIAANKALGLGERFLEKDYTFLGVVGAAIERLDSKAELLLNSENENSSKSCIK